MSVAQSKTIRLLAVFITLSLAIPVTFAQGLPPLTHGMTLVKSPYQAPELKLQDMDEGMVDISQMKGKTLVINFWATWCPPCRREMGSLERLHQATASKDVQVIAVNIGEDEDIVFSFLGTIEPSPTFPIVFDHSAESMGRWKVKGLPTTYVIDPDGMVTYRVVGGREFDHPDIVSKILALSQ